MVFHGVPLVFGLYDVGHVISVNGCNQFGRNRLAGEAEPGVALFPYFTAGAKVFGICVQEASEACLKRRAIGVLLHGEAVYAGLVEVRAAAVPHLHGAVAHALVKEGHVGFGLGLSHLLCGNEFGVLA